MSTWTLSRSMEPNETPPNYIRFDNASENLFQMESTKDLTIVAGNGAEVKCHRVVFEAQSPSLAELLSPDSKENKRMKLDRIQMKEISEEGLGHLIRLLYGMKIATSDLTLRIVLELFKAARAYQIPQLEDGLLKEFRRKINDWLTADVMHEYFQAKDSDEMITLLVIIIKSFSIADLGSTPGFKVLNEEQSQAFMADIWNMMRELQGGVVSEAPSPSTAPRSPDDDDDVPRLPTARIELPVSANAPTKRKSLDQHCCACGYKH